MSFQGSGRRSLSRFSARSPPRAGALRELEEETGVAPALVEILAEAPAPLEYDLPPELQRRLWGGRYRGQRQHYLPTSYSIHSDRSCHSPWSNDNGK